MPLVRKAHVAHGTTGVADGRKRLVYSAEMVHDFAWFADPDFVEYHGEHGGIRIEDNVVITEDGVESFTDFMPAELDDIEKLMREEGIVQIRPEVED